MNKIIIVILVLVFSLSISYNFFKDNHNSFNKINTNNFPSSITNSISSTIKPTYFDSKLLNLRFHPSSDITGKYTSLYNGTIEEFNFYKGLRMTIYITSLPSDTPHPCRETLAEKNEYQVFGNKEVSIAGKIPLYFIHSNYDPRKGYSVAEAATKINKDDQIICIDVYQEISPNGDTEDPFDQILINASNI